MDALPAGGGGPSGTLIVGGGSGATYTSIALAVAGEVAAGEYSLVGGNAAQAGTTAGSVVGPAALSAVDGSYENWYLVDQDGVPSSPILGRAWARVSRYVGATRTLTLDRALPFVPGDTFYLVKPVRVMLLRDLTETVVLAGTGVELELGGYKLTGSIDIGGGDFYFIRGGGGYITGGVQVTAGDPTLILERLRIGRRNGQVFAVDVTSTALFNLSLVQCILNGTLSFVGKARAVIEAWKTDFAGLSAGLCIVPSGATRPAFYRLWDCLFAGDYNNLQPERIKVWDVLPAARALAQGQPLTIDAAGQAELCIGTDIVEGTCLEAVSGIGVQTVLVREGEVFCAVNAAVAAGNNLALEILTPTQYNTSAFVPGQNAGRALAAAAGGLAYASVLHR